jgi:hypothetical protein
MSTAGQLIDDAKEYASDASDEATTAITTYETAIDSLADAMEFMSNITVNSYSGVGGAWSALLYELAGDVADRKIEMPNNLGDYNTPSPPAYQNVETGVLKDRVFDLINVISTIPDRIAEALQIIDAVASKVYSDLLNGGYGIDVNDELALYERTRDRELLSSLYTLEELKKQHSAFGMPMPTGAYNAALEKLLEKSFDAVSNFNRDLYSKRAELFRLARSFAIEKGIELGKEQLGITDMKVKALIGAATAAYEALRIEVENHKEKLATYNAELMMIFENQKTLLGIYNGNIEVWKGRISAIVNSGNLAVEAAKFNVEADKLQLDQEIEKAKASILAFNASVNAKTAGIQAILNVYAHKVSGALSSITAVAQEIAQEG